MVVQLHPNPMHPPGYGPGYRMTSSARYYCRTYREENISSLGATVQHIFRRALLLPSREENINRLGAAVQHRRTLLVPSRENINSLGAALQHNFRRTLLLPSREENISSLCAAVQHIFRRTLLQ